MASDMNKTTGLYCGYAAPYYDLEKLLQFTYGDRYYLQASQKEFEDMFDAKDKKHKEPVVELSSQKLIEIAKQALKNGDLVIAEQCLGKAVRKEKLENASSERNIESYFYLAEVLERTSEKDNVELLQRQRFLLQAAALYNFVKNCATKSTAKSDFSKKMMNRVSQKILNVQDSLVLSVDGSPVSCKFNTENKKKVLAKLREDAKCYLKTVEGKLPNETGNDEELRDMFVEQTTEIRTLFKTISSRIKKLLAGIIQEGLEVLGTPPCDYEIIVLGSLAREEMTPYSDLEWAILTSSEEEKCKVFFRNLTNLVHLQIINLGETILPCMDIKALNGEWFYDDVTPRGVSLDAFLPQASKTPLGNTQDFELIHTPAKMADFQSNYWYKKNPGLGEILLTVAPLEDDKHILVEKYRIEVEKFLGSPCDLEDCHHNVSSGNRLTRGACRGLSTLRKDVFRYGVTMSEMNDGKLYDVKKEIYRLTDRVVAGLAKCFRIAGNGAFEILDGLSDRGVIRPSARDNIASAVGIALKLRLNTYLEAGKQQEEINAQPTEGAITSEAIFAYRMPREKELFHFFYVTIPLYEKLYRFCSDDKNRSHCFSDELFFDHSDATKGQTYCRVVNYSKALECYERALESDPGNIDIELNQIRMEFMMKDSENAITSIKGKLDALLQKVRRRYDLPETPRQNNLDHAEVDFCSDLAECKQMLVDNRQLVQIFLLSSHIHQFLGDLKTARLILDQCMKMEYRLGFDSNSLQTLMTRLHLIELTITSEGGQVKEDQFKELVPELTSLIESEGVSFKGLVWLTKLGEFLLYQGKLNESYRCLQRALTMGRTLCGVNPNLIVAHTLLLLGIVATGLFLLEEGKFYLEQLLQLQPPSGTQAWLIIFKVVYRFLGIICANTNHHQEAISNLQKGLAVKTCETSVHFCLDCLVYCEMAKSWYVLGSHEKACQSASEAEECLKKIFDVNARAMLTCYVTKTYLEVGKNKEAMKLMKQELEQLDLQSDAGLKARYLYFLGDLYMRQGISADAEHYFKKALDILETRKADVLYIVECLLNISNIFLENGKFSEAISYVDDAWKYVSTMTANQQKCSFLKRIADCWEKLSMGYQAQRCLEEALRICKDSMITSKVELTEFDLHVKLGNLAESVSNPTSRNAEISLSTEQLRKAKRYHYDQAGKVLRRITASGSFNSAILILFAYLASKYDSIDLLEQEKLLLEALKMSEEIYTTGQVNETVASVLISLSDVYLQKEDYENASNCLDRSLKMEMEIHSSDPYHSHISNNISILSSLYMEYPGSKQLQEAAHSVVKFLERENKGEGSTNDANNANGFVAIAQLFVCLGDFERAEKFNRRASDIFVRIEESDVTKRTLLNTEMCHLMTKILELVGANPMMMPLFKAALSSGRLAALLKSRTANTASPQLNVAFPIGKFLKNSMSTTVDDGNSSKINRGDNKALPFDGQITESDEAASRCTKPVSADASIYEVSTRSNKKGTGLAEDQVSPQPKGVPANEVTDATSLIATRFSLNSNMPNESGNWTSPITKSERMPQEKSNRATIPNVFPNKSRKSSSTEKSELNCDMASNSRAHRDAIEKNDYSSPGIQPPSCGMEENLNKGDSCHRNREEVCVPETVALDDSVKKSPENKIFESKMHSLAPLMDSIKYDLTQGNMLEAEKNLEHHLFPFFMSAFEKVGQDPVQSFLNEALRTKDDNEIGLTLFWLHLATKYPSHPERKAEILKITGQCHLLQQHYRMAAISFTEAVALLKVSDNINQTECLDSLIGLIKSRMYCNDPEDALLACQEGIALTSAMEPGLAKYKHQVQLLHLAAKCTFKLSSHLPTQDQGLRKVVLFCQQALSASKELDDRTGSSNLIEELGGSDRGESFALKCETELLLATSLTRLKDSQEARRIVREMNEFLGNIAVVFETFSKDTWPGGHVSFFKIYRRLFSWIGQALVMSGKLNVALDPLKKSLTAFLIGFSMDIIAPPEEVLALMDTITVSKSAAAQMDRCPLQQTLDLCKQVLLEQDIDFTKIQNFFGSLGNLYVDCGRTNDAIVVYETGLAVAECMDYTDANSSRRQMLLYLAGTYRLQAMKNTGKVAAEQRCLAKKYYLTAQTIKDSSFATDLIFAYFLAEDGRLEKAIHVLEKITDDGVRLWNENMFISYHKRTLFGPGVRKYIESYGQLLAPIGNLVYTLLTHVWVAMGKRKEAVRAFEKLSTNGRDLRQPFDNRPPSLPFLLCFCQRSLQSLIGDGSHLQFVDSDYPLSTANLAKMYYELGEFELTLEYCNKAMKSSEGPEALDGVQRQLLSLRLAGNALLMLERKNESYSYFTSFLNILQNQTNILNLPFEEQQAILAKFFFANGYYVYRSLGRLLVGRGNVDGAMQCYEHCLDLDRDYICDQNLVGTLAELYQMKAFTTGKDEEVAHQRWMKKAQHCFQELYRRNTKLTPFVEGAFGSFLCRTESLDEAVFHFENVLNGTDDSLIAFANEDKPLLSEHLQREIETRSSLLLPIKIYVYNQAALAYSRLGKDDDVRKTILRMKEHVDRLESSPYFPLILSVLGYTYQETGNKRKAAEIFTAVLEISPDHPPVKLALDSCNRRNLANYLKKLLKH